MSTSTHRCLILFVVAYASLILSRAAAAQNVEEEARAAFRDDAHASAGLTNWVGLQESAVCARCHDETSGGARTIVAVRQGLDRLGDQIATAEDTLSRAERAGMLVDDGRGAQREATNNWIHSRVLVLGCAVKPFDEMAGQGFAASARARRVGDDALAELQFRRQGLWLATFLILGFLVTLWWKIRQLPPAESSAETR